MWWEEREQLGEFPAVSQVRRTNGQGVGGGSLGLGFGLRRGPSVGVKVAGLINAKTQVAKPSRGQNEQQPSDGHRERSGILDDE